MTAEERTLYTKRYRITKFIRFFVLQLCAPVVAALVIWGITKEPRDLTIFDQIGVGVMVAGFIVVISMGNFMKEVMDQIKLDRRLVFSKNYTVVFLIVAGLLFLLQGVIEDAILFFAISGGAHALAYLVELIEKRYKARLGGVVNG